MQNNFEQLYFLTTSGATLGISAVKQKKTQICMFLIVQIWLHHWIQQEIKQWRVNK